MSELNIKTKKEVTETKKEEPVTKSVTVSEFQAKAEPTIEFPYTIKLLNKIPEHVCQCCGQRALYILTKDDSFEDRLKLEKDLSQRAPTKLMCEPCMQLFRARFLGKH